MESFLKERLNYVKQVSELFWAQDKLHLNISSEEARQKSQLAYQQELSNSEGLGFGIISSSLTAHLLYAWQASRKEQENIKNAERIADEVYKANNPFSKADALTSSFYDTNIEKLLIDSLTEFYGALEYLIYEKSNNLELFHNNNCNVDTTRTSYNEIDENRKYVLESFSSNIFNGEIVVFAICNNLIDDSFVEFFNSAPNLLHINSQKSIIDYLKNQKQKSKELKENIFNEKILNIISQLKRLFQYNKNEYSKILETAYRNEIRELCGGIQNIVEWTDETIRICAEIPKHVSISTESIISFLRWYKIFDTVSLNKAVIKLELTDNESTNIDKIQSLFNQMNDKIDVEIKCLKKNLISEIESLKNELSTLRFAFLGEKAKRRKYLIEQISKKEQDLAKFKQFNF